MKRKQYTKEFKLEACRLLEQGHKSGALLARELGVRRNQPYKWCHELQQRGVEAAFEGPGRNSALENVSELAALRKRIVRLEEENAILKKAEAYFSDQRQ